MTTVPPKPNKGHKWIPLLNNNSYNFAIDYNICKICGLKIFYFAPADKWCVEYSGPWKGNPFISCEERIMDEALK